MVEGVPPAIHVAGEGGRVIQCKHLTQFTSTHTLCPVLFSFSFLFFSMYLFVLSTYPISILFALSMLLLSQVERLLRESCNEVLGGARALLLHALAAEGVHLDGATLVATTYTTSKNQSNHHHHDSNNGLGLGTGTGAMAKATMEVSSTDNNSDYHDFSSTMATILSSHSSLCHAPSPRLFRRAEAVRQYMQDELADLLHDVVRKQSLTYSFSSAFNQ